MRSFYAKFVKQTFESKPQRLEELINLIEHSMQNSSNKLLKANHNNVRVNADGVGILCKIRQTNF